MIKLALAMIVKNEERVIKRCLESVKPFISYWVISDTGSTDNTKAIIEETMRGIPGQLVSHPWVNWAVNRSIPLELARIHSGCEYTLAVLDADEVLEVKDPSVLQKLSAPAYMVMRALGETEFGRVSIFKNTMPWMFEGEKHESHALKDNAPHHIGDLPGVRIVNLADGAAAWDPVASIARYSAEAEEFLQKVQANPTDTRSWFYLAQSYRDSLQNANAIEAYEKRASLGGWNEEVYISLLQVARIKADIMGASEENVTVAFLRAHAVMPERAEAIYYLGRHLREIRKNYKMAEIYLRQAAAIKRPSCNLFVEPAIYEWRAKDELAVTLTWTGKHQEAIGIFQWLLEHGPASERARNATHIQLCLDNGAVLKALSPKAPTATEGSASVELVVAEPELVKLNLGCGTRMLQGYINVDLAEPADQVFDLNTPWVNWADSSVDEIRAVHVFEYLTDPIFVMNEAYRVLKNGGKLIVSLGEEAGDPMVKNHWIMSTLDFFCVGKPAFRQNARRYGIAARFQRGEAASDMTVELTAVK